MKLLLLPIVFLLFLSVPAFAMDGNVLWLPFENNVLDDSGLGNDGNMNNGTFVTGKFGQAFREDSVDYDFIWVNDSESLNFEEGNFTLDFWMKPDTCGGSVFSKSVGQIYNSTYPYEYTGEELNQGWFDNNLQDATSFNAWAESYFNPPESNCPDCYTDYFSGKDYDCVVSLDIYGTDLSIHAPVWTGEWNHIVFVRNGLWNYSIYSNGEFYGNPHALSLENSNVSSFSDVIVGAYTDTGVNPPLETIGYDSLYVLYTGSIDEFRLWNRALNDTEVSNLYNYNSLESPPPAEPDQTLLMVKPIILLLIGVGLVLFIFKTFREGEINAKTMVGALLTIMIGLAFVMAIGGIA